MMGKSLSAEKLLQNVLEFLSIFPKFFVAEKACQIFWQRPVASSAVQ